MGKIDVSVLIGGKAGQGIQTVGQLVAMVCHRAGLYVMGINDFESRIRGGHSYFKVRISNQPINAPAHEAQLLVALDLKTRNIHKTQLATHGRVLIDASADADEDTIPVPFVTIAKEAGGRMVANTVAAGACLSLLGASLTLFEEIIRNLFTGKAEDVLQKNLRAASLGYEAVQGRPFHWKFDWPTDASSKGRLIDGAEAVALGALAGDCRFAAFYPMSPATGIMSYLTGMAPDFPLMVEQAEDEIAAINMIIGASFSGARSMTATSGGGFCLMTEGLGLAAITETPIVVVNAQRPGPATGLPTRTSQSDLLFMIHASQDEFPRFVFAPATPHDAYLITARAFDLAEKYQVPAIIMVDQFFNDSVFTATEDFVVPEAVSRYTVEDADLPENTSYHRFKITESGISPRALPSAGKALVMVSSDEHTEDGHITEEIGHRVAMVDKRFAKLLAMQQEMRPPIVQHEKSEVMLVSWGSTYGAIIEAISMLREDGIDIGSIHFSDIWPFPVDTVMSILKKTGQFFTVEQNRTAQLGQLICHQTGLKSADALLKYDGRPFYPHEIAVGIQSKLR